MKDYYTYMLINSITKIPFYVGFGHGNRMYSHKSVSMSGKNPNRNNYSLGHTIRKLIRDGGDIIYKQITNLTVEQAKAEEIKKIKQIGRLDLGTGPLCNLTDGGDGTTVWSEYRRQKMSDHKKSMTDMEKEKIVKKFRETIKSIDNNTKVEYVDRMKVGIKKAHIAGKYKSSLAKLHEENSKRFSGKNNPMYKHIDDEIVNEMVDLYVKGWGIGKISKYFVQIKGKDIRYATVRQRLKSSGVKFRPPTKNLKNYKNE